MQFLPKQVFLHRQFLCVWLRIKLNIFFFSFSLLLQVVSSSLRYSVTVVMKIGFRCRRATQHIHYSDQSHSETTGISLTAAVTSLIAAGTSLTSKPQEQVSESTLTVAVTSLIENSPGL